MIRIFVLVSLALASCSQPEPEDAVTVRWSMSGLSCKEAGVRTVHVFFGPLGPGAYDRDIDCEVGEQGASLVGIAPGTYDVVIKGFGDEVMKFWLQTQVEVTSPTEDLGSFELMPYEDPPAP